ncbi:MAG TPA: lanthionine synthetase LanC family protein [Flavobacterium sp.]|nr:lanthionine synthetase LanC family protein [Flavobacterium sp.]
MGDHTISFSRQQRIRNCLLLNASFIDNLGIMHGKMGIAIYFFHLARETQNQIYENYAGELIDEIYDEITIQTSCDFENGLAGIGWGIEYLDRNGFIEADTDEVLEDFDNRIIHEITHHVPDDAGILQGIFGYIVYFLKRIKSGSKKKPALKRALLKTVLLLQKYIDKSDIDFNRLWKEPEKFDIAWNYTSVLWVLAELFHEGLYKRETVQTLKKLLSVHKDYSSLLQLHSHRLVLALIIEKLRKLRNENLFDSDLAELSIQLTTEIKRETIREELEPNSAFFRNGASGISILYRQLYLLTRIPIYEIESIYWKSYIKELPESDQGYAGFFMDKKNEDKAFGILNGLAGIGLTEMKSVINKITQP